MAHTQDPTQDPTPDRVIHYAPGSVLGPGDRPPCGNESATAVYSEDPRQVAGCDDCDDQGGQWSSAGHVDRPGGGPSRGIAVAKGGGRQTEAESRCALSRFKATVSRRPVIRGRLRPRKRQRQRRRGRLGAARVPARPDLPTC